jgi:3-hydroxyacyl-CoA dehydrogenase/3-hydroxy-2-methylbutyryl-CoA dehydrogenase
MNCASAVCVVTGASSGLGRAVAEELLRRGARVAALDIVPCPDFNAPMKAFRSLVADVTDDKSVKAAIDGAAQHFGAIHVCLNCAGTVEGTPMLTADGQASSLESFRRVVEINLNGTCPRRKRLL